MAPVTTFSRLSERGGGGAHRAVTSSKLKGDTALCSGKPEETTNSKSEGRARDLDADVVAPPGFLRLGAGERAQQAEQRSAFRGQMVVDGVRERPYEAFRLLLQAEDLKRFPAVWQSRSAFVRPDCTGCEASLFESRKE